MKKQNYTAPVMEQMEVRVETGFLTLSNGGGAQAPNVQSMGSSDIYDGAAW